jgi:nitrate/nitrite transporter NarK
MVPVFWSLPGRFLSGAAAAAGIALINSFGNLGGFAGSFITGMAKQLTGSAAAGTYALGACLWVCGVIVVLMPRTIFSSGRALSTAEDSVDPNTAPVS